MKFLLSFFLFILCFSVEATDIDPWTSPESLSTSLVNASAARVGVDSNGNVVAAWIENGKVVSKNQLANGTLSALNTVSGSGASAPQIVVDPNGNAALIWVANGAVQAATQSFGGSWSAVHTLAASGSTPQIAVDNSGNIVTVWNAGGIIQSATKLFNQSWPVLADSFVTVGADTPQVAISSNGSVVIAWHAVNAISLINNVYTASKTLVGGIWGAIQTISTATQNSIYPQIAIDSSGNILTTWFSYNLTGSVYSNVIVQASIYSVSTLTWSSPTNLSAAGIRNPSDLTLSAAFTNAGDALVTWINSYDGDTYTVQTTIYNAVGGWQSSRELQVDLYARFVNSALTSGGDAFIAYMTSEGSNSTFAIQTAESNVGGPLEDYWQAVADISSGTLNCFPQIAARQNTTNVYVAAVWLNNNGTTISVQCATTSGILIQPASALSLAQTTNNYGGFSETLNTLTWVASPDLRVDSYALYRNGTLISTVPSTQVSYVDHNVVTSGTITYTLGALSGNSQSATISVTH